MQLRGIVKTFGSRALRVAIACDRSRAEGRPVAVEEVSDDDA